jgi:hypothetical protein
MIHYRLAVHHEKFLPVEVEVKKRSISNKHFFMKGNRTAPEKGGLAGFRPDWQGPRWSRGFSGAILFNLLLDQTPPIL